MNRFFILILKAVLILQTHAHAATVLPSKCTPNLDLVPKISVTGHPEWTTVFNFAWSNWKRLILVNTKMYNPCWIDEGFGAGGATWQWDTNFGTLGARWGYQVYPAIETQDNFYFAQSSNGFIGQKLSENSETFKSTSVNPPFYSWIEWEYYQISGDKSRFTKSINGRSVIQHLRDHFYFFWNSSTYHRTDGTWIWSGIDSGRDCVSAASYVDLPAQLATTAYYLSKMADLSGSEFYSIRDDMRSKYALLVNFLNSKHWNPSTKFYENLNSSGQFDPSQDGPQGLWTLIGRIPSSEQLNYLIENLSNTNTLNRYHRVPSVSATSPYYNGGCKWYGPIWPPDVIQIVKGLLALNQYDVAYNIARNDVEKTATTFSMNSGHLCENYRSERDGCYGGTDLTWSSAGFVVSLLEGVLGLQPDAPNDTLNWTINLTEEFSVQQLRFGDNIIALSSNARPNASSGASITVKTNSPFTLKVLVAGNLCIQSIGSGELTFVCPLTP